MQGKPGKQSIYRALSQVIDPELNCNVVDLGLIYEVNVTDDGFVQVIMTLTTKGCPLGDSLVNGVEAALECIPGVRHGSVDLVWEPPWHPGMMSEAAQKRLGISCK